MRFNAYLLLTALLWSLGSPHACQAQYLVWQAYDRAGAEAYADHDLNGATENYKRALAEARRGSYLAAIAHSGIRLGDLQYERGDFASAADSFAVSLRAFEANRESNPKEDGTKLGGVDVLSALSGMAAASQRLGKLEDAEQFLRLGMRIEENRQECDLCRQMQLLNGLSECKFAQRDLIAVEALTGEAQRLVSTVGESHPLVGDLQMLQAALLSERGDHAAATELAHSSLSLMHKNYPPGSPKIAWARLLLGQIEHGRGSHTAGTRSVSTATEALRDALTGDHPDVETAERLHAASKLLSKPTAMPAKPASGKTSPSKSPPLQTDAPSKKSQPAPKAAKK